MKLIRQSEVYLMEEAVTEQIIKQAASDYGANIPQAIQGERTPSANSGNVV